MAQSLTTTIVTQGGSIVEPDSAITVNHGNECETTTHPIEDGTSITDHIIRKPNTVSLRLLFSPFPLSGDDLAPRGVDRPVRAFDVLSRAMQRRETVTIATDGQFYGPAVITKLGMDRSFEDGSSRTLTVEATEIVQIVSKTIALQPANAIRHGTGKKKSVVPLTKAQVATAAAIAAATGHWGNAAAILTGL